MKIVYIAHPVAGDISHNLSEIKRLVRMIYMNVPDVVPIAPYVTLLVDREDNIENRSIGMNINREILESGIVNELWLYGGRISGGMKREIEICRKAGIPVKCHSPEIMGEFIKLYNDEDKNSDAS